MSVMLDIKNLHVGVNTTPILHGVDLRICAGEVHAVMGPNGSGKSTLAHVLAGHPDMTVHKGTMRFLGKDIGGLAPDARAAMGLALTFQYPVEIEGVTIMTFLKAALEAQRKARGETPLSPKAFLTHIRACAQQLNIKDEDLRRWLNVGFSGGEKKRLEMLQMAVLEPSLMVFDEVDSGLDVDALKLVAAGIQSLQRKNRAQLIITHYQRLLNYVRPTHVHILRAGRIVESGDASLAERIEKTGYQAYESPRQSRAQKLTQGAA